MGMARPDLQPATRNIRKHCAAMLRAQLVRRINMFSFQKPLNLLLVAKSAFGRGGSGDGSFA